MFLAVLLHKYEDDLQKLGLRIKQHEDHIKSLKTQKNILEDSIHDMQGMQYQCWNQIFYILKVAFHLHISYHYFSKMIYYQLAGRCHMESIIIKISKYLDAADFLLPVVTLLIFAYDTS